MVGPFNDWDGRRQILGVEMANRESSSSWKDFLMRLRERGLRVRRLDRTLATMDHSTPTETDQIFGGVPMEPQTEALRRGGVEPLLGGEDEGAGHESSGHQQETHLWLFLAPIPSSSFTVSR